MNNKVVKGYKVFNPDWTCRDVQYEVGKMVEVTGKPKCCEWGVHFCNELANCFNYYPFNPANKVAEIEAVGEIDTNDDGKSCTNKIRIIRELSWEEVLRLVNLGVGNSGLLNSGNYNSGNYNSGNRNSGNFNSGYFNSGGFNSGYCNSGDSNSGNHNSGYYNSGGFNSGYSNSGDSNSGNRNSGNYNSGNFNSGDSNSGNFNSGWYNSGYCNSTTPKVRLFNHETDLGFDSKEIRRLMAILCGCPQSYIHSDFIWKENMTDEEIKKHPECETIGGYVKIIVVEADKQKWWDEKVDDSDKEFIKSLPHFDADVFYECVGVRV